MLTSRPATCGEAQSVLGPVPAERLGVTMVHEHLLHDASCLYAEPSGGSERGRARERMTLGNLAWVRRNWNSNHDNLHLDDEALAIKEVMELKLEGGDTLVEVSNIGLERDPHGLQRIARATDLHIIMGAGYYVDSAHPPGMDERSEAEIEDEIVHDVLEGVGTSGVRAGIIGELGCSWPLTRNEAKVLRAAAKAQHRCGAAITIHIGRDVQSPVEIADCLDDAGADLSRVILGHMDRIEHPMSIMCSLAARGCYIAFDTFGQETWVYPFSPADRLTDAQRVELQLALIAEGFLDRLLVSHDIGYKHRLSAYGGCGYAHILSTVVPYHMRRKGMTEEHLHAILVGNPARVLPLVESVDG